LSLNSNSRLSFGISLIIPTVQAEISGGKVFITGKFTVEEAKNLAYILKSEKLPARVVILEEVIE
jgi:preprotein translocase subunit SecD|tara:strand:+ start:117 stop:311 length:195 start_codon:yes stop_codon:yes gene_type:complete